jgi:hypothetical protein
VGTKEFGDSLADPDTLFHQPPELCDYSSVDGSNHRLLSFGVSSALVKEIRWPITPQL